MWMHGKKFTDSEYKDVQNFAGPLNQAGTHHLIADYFLNHQTLIVFYVQCLNLNIDYCTKINNLLLDNDTSSQHSC